MYPSTGYGPRTVPTKTQEELDMDAALAASLVETTRPSYGYGYGESIPTEHEDPALAAVLEASRLDAERERRAAEQAQFEAISRRNHQLPRVSPQTSSSTVPTTTLSEAEQIHLAELLSQFELQQEQKRRQEQQDELARFAALSPSYPTIQSSAPFQPYSTTQPSYYHYPSTQPTTYPSAQPTYAQPSYPSAQPTYPTTSQFQPSRLTPSLPSDSMPTYSVDPIATPSEEEQLRQVELLSLREHAEEQRRRQEALAQFNTYTSSYYSQPTSSDASTPTRTDEQLRQAELLSLREQTEAERLQEQQRQQEEEELATVLRRSETERYSNLPHQMGDRSYQLRPAFQMPTRAAAPLPTTIQGSSTLEDAVGNAGRINKLRFNSYKIERNEIGNPYLVLTYVSTLHRNIAEQELRTSYGMFQMGAPQGAGTTQLILSVEQTREFQTKF